MTLLPSLKFKVMISDGEHPTRCLAAFEEDLDAWRFMDEKLDFYLEEPGPSPTLWMEEFVDERWIVSRKTDVGRIKQDILDRDLGSRRRRLIHRHLTPGEKDIIVRSMKLMLRQNKGALRSRTIQEFEWMFSQLDHDDNKGWTNDQIKELIFEPMRQIERMTGLIAFIENRGIIIESHLTIPELF